MRIFITGATGFIGSHIVDKLTADGHQLLLLALDAAKKQLNNARCINNDLKNLSSYYKEITDFNPEICIHAAWEGLPDYTSAISKLNLQTSISLLDFLVESTNCRKIINTGSCFEYGKNFGPCVEADTAASNSFFAWAKNSLNSYGELLTRQNNVGWIWTRIFYVYGVGQRSQAIIPTIVDSLMQGNHPLIRNPLNANDFINIKDVAEAFSIMIKNDIPSGIYNLGTGLSSRISCVSELIEKQLNRYTGKAYDFNRTFSGNEEMNFWADMTKTYDTLHWQPSTSLENGIMEYIESKRK